MKIKSQLSIDINVNIKVTDVLTGKILKEISGHNLTMTDGKTLVAHLLAITAAKTGITYFGVGTGSVAPVASDVALGTEVFRDTLTNAIVTSGKVNIQYYLNSGDANGNTLTEAGLFGGDASAIADSGTLFARYVYAGIVKTASIAITYSWDININ